SPRLTRKTVVFTSLSRPLPASSRIARRLAKSCSVCSLIDAAWISVSPGLSASCPETNTRSPARIACEYGAPWKGAGAFSVLMTILSVMRLLLPPARAARLGERHPERLEDRLEDVVGVRAVDQTDVERQGGSVDELAQECRDEIRGQAADPGTG